MKFRKKPVEIEAVQWTGINYMELFSFGAPISVIEGELVVKTLEDGSKSQIQHIASIGDWIICGVQGEYYPCKPDIFEKTYERID